MKFLWLLLLFPFIVKAQEEPPKIRNYETSFIEKAPVIDGILNDSIWANAKVASDFIQSTPNPKEAPSQKTEVRLLYDNEAIYVAARMYEKDPDSINNFLTERDWIGNADFFVIVFNTYQDGINGEGFLITPSGVQFDTKYSTDDENKTWDAVWESATSIDDKGWTAELKIPFSALRFPEVDKQIWGINFGREIRRKRERSWWNFIDPTVDGFLTQAGIVEGIENIKPPVRLFLFPYTSSYAEFNSANGGSETYSFNAGMDLKYGLSDAFTLDMTLIPDFGQARFDNQVLNLTAFEVQFNENRQFFTEGVELFNKADLFYSRRIGGRPYNFSLTQDLDSTETVSDNPIQSQLLNATKISGRNKNGLGIGVFNAVENREFATIRNNETGASRKVKTNPLTNYSVIVVDQVVRNNSFVTFTNTNVTRNGSARDANVSKLDFKIADKKNQYAASGNVGMSNIFKEDGEISSGHIWQLNLEKISGNLTYGIGQEQKSDQFNPNDLGFLNINNLESSYIYGAYANYDPKNFNFRRYDADIVYERLHSPNEFVNVGASVSTVYGLKSFHAFGLNAGIEPIKTNDFFETRTFEQYYKFPRNFWFGGFFSSDYSRPFALDLRYQHRVFDESGRYNRRIFISPRLRPNDKLFFVIRAIKAENFNEMGFVNNTNDSIHFGRRLVTEYETSIDGSYIFNNKMALSLNLRHYWSTAVYNRFNLVDSDNGSLLLTDYEGFNEDGTSIHDRSFNAFNIDLRFRWRFAPGSDLNVVWKNIIIKNGDPLERNYLRELDETISAPQVNNFSIKVLYFIDYLSLKKKDRETS